MGKLINLCGQRFGLLTVIEVCGRSKDGQKTWLCECDCGNKTIVRSGHLHSGHTKSCGCANIKSQKLNFQKMINRNKVIHPRFKHGFTHSKLYQIWKGIKARCLNKNTHAYCNYGGRGITICDEWENDFMNFYTWAYANGYKEGLSIDRINNEGNYEPHNCRWILKKDQNKNKRSNHLIIFNNETHTIAEWSRITNIKSGTILYRIQNGWSIEKCLTIRT